MAAKIMKPMNHYYPFGALFAESTNGTIQKYKYNGKELDTTNNLNLYDYGVRSYDSVLGIWTTQDPLVEKYYPISPYAYCLNNPVNAVDPDGLYPRSVLIYDPKLGLYGGYRFTQSAAQLLSLVSGVSRIYIDNTVVQERASGQYRPFYSASKSGGAITLGSGVLKFQYNIYRKFL